MSFDGKRPKSGQRQKPDKSIIKYNKYITLRNIPEAAYEYVVNGKSAIGWIMDRYQVKTDKKSGLENDPNEYSQDPRYILGLLLRVIRVSVESAEQIERLSQVVPMFGERSAV